MSMSIAPTTAATGLSVTDEAHAPAAVRNGSASVKKAYASAQGFEEMLMLQLSQEMLQSSGLGSEGGSEGEGEEGSGAGGSGGEGGMLASLLPQALTEGVMREGGLGLATQLMSSLDPAATAAGAASAAGAGTTGGTTALQSASDGAAAGAGSTAAGTGIGAGTSTGARAGAAAAGTSVQASGGVAA
jgi:hypothetical protein